MTNCIAIVGMACRYADASRPEELWENALAGRRAFRRMPQERLRLEDYLSADRQAPDSIYSTEAALIEGYEFDRVRFRVAGSTFRSADPAHWLALDVAAQALCGAGFAEGIGLPRETTGVFLGNTLTGEFSRANMLRLRWPYVRRVVEASLKVEDLPGGRINSFLKRLEALYKEPFTPIGEESLAGGLSNTIAGRICNYFDLKGGGYTVDGACASSLLAVANACAALASGDLDVALAGGVDLSLDPFELVGFAKTGALASTLMRVYDKRSDGFWPGEGCGFLLLMRYEDALVEKRNIYALIRGWGVSSDGNGGITRPEVKGQLLALRRAYRRAGFGIETVAYFEGHGTGTSVGDATELRALSIARREALSEAPPAAIGSIKANIGHTKAAAGVAGMIKAAMALQTKILPPMTGCEDPHDELCGQSPALRVLGKGEPWPSGQFLRAGVSSMGFGGINVHIVLEGVQPGVRRALNYRERALLSSAQDAELFLLGAQSVAALQSQVEHLSARAAGLSRAELSDLAAQLEKGLGHCDVRAAVTASCPAGLATRLRVLRSIIERATTHIDEEAGVFFGAGNKRPRIGLLFPGQGSPSRPDGGFLRRRFDCVEELYSQAQLVIGEDDTLTGVAQPAIVTASMAALRLLSRLDIAGTLAVGHSLGELTALHWAGAFDEGTLLRIAQVRGKAMMERGEPDGAMASIAAGRAEVEALLNGDRVVIAAMNSPSQTVLSGEADAIASVTARARAKSLATVMLPVSHAFHSPLVAAAVPVLAEHLSRERFKPLERTVVSTVTGEALTPEINLKELLYRQITSPVLFMAAATEADSELIDLWLEVGPGNVLGGLMRQISNTPLVSLDAGGPSLKGLLNAVAAAFVSGHPVNHEALFAGRFTRPLNLDVPRKFFVNPCELAPASDAPAQSNGDGASAAESYRRMEPAVQGVGEEHAPSDSATTLGSALDLVIQLVADRAELPPSAVSKESRLLGDLHLNSITVSQIVVEAARHLGLPRPVSPTDFAGATVAQMAQTLEDLMQVGRSPVSDEDEVLPAGVDSWFRPFSVELIERPLPKRKAAAPALGWQVLAPPDYPLASSLQQAFDDCYAGGGVVVCLPPKPDEQYLSLLLGGARAALAERVGARFVLVQHGGGAASFARTLHLEASHIPTCVVDVPFGDPQAVELIVDEALAAEDYTEVYYEADGRRLEPVLRPLSLCNEGAGSPIKADDVLVVTGGGKGITAECVLELVRGTGARLALLGLALPEHDAELKENLKRMSAADITFRYISVDVTDAQAVKEAIQRVVDDFGPVTGIIHGAARNVPRLLSDLKEEEFCSTLAVKVKGARNLLSAVDPQKLRLLVTFGSIIARTGLPGEADYGLANEWLTRLTEQWQAAHPHCRCVAVEWSIWSGVGMGARLGRIDSLIRQGIIPIPPDEGVSILRQLLRCPLPKVAAIVMGRFREMCTLRVEQPELPLKRFLEQARVYYPKVELVVDVDLSTGTDPYLDDHQVQGERLFPAVMGLEAMAQVATALAETDKPPVFHEVSFNRPMIVPAAGSLKIRIAALARAKGVIEVVLRSEETAFKIDHFRAVCRFSARPLVGDEPKELIFENAGAEVSIDPDHDLYGRILFHRGRFRRLSGYRLLKATECLAEIDAAGTTSWFNHYLPDTLVLGDPGARDAALHAVQACIPHATLLPTAVEKVCLDVRQTSVPLLVHAQERSRAGDTFIYDIQVIEAGGSVRERWDGLRLRAVNTIAPQGPWPAALLSPYVERRVRELIPRSPCVTVALESGEALGRCAQSERAIQSALGESKAVIRRPDGRPEINSKQTVSAAHAGCLTLAVAGTGRLGCDVEQVVRRPPSLWKDLLGETRLALAEIISHEALEDMAVSATRAWAAQECLKKAGAAIDAPLMLASTGTEGWVLLSSGSLMVATYAAQVRGFGNRLVIAVLLESQDERV